MGGGQGVLPWIWFGASNKNLFVGEQSEERTEKEVGVVMMTTETGIDVTCFLMSSLE